MLAPIKTIIVDDDVLIRSALKHMVEEFGLQVIGETVDAATAKSLIKQEPPQVLFLDIVLPGEDGHAVLAFVNDNYPDMKVIMMTSEPTKENVVKAASLGVAGFVAKPFNVNNVREAVQRIMVDLRKEKEPSSSPVEGIDLS